MLVCSGVALGAQGEVEIVHDPIECWPVDQFLLIQSSFVPPEDIQTAKFYFRSTAHPDYYYVELTLGPQGGRTIAPKAEANTPGVTSYLELVTRSYTAFRTEERTVPVASGDECKRRDPETAYYTGENPDIAVGATRAGATPMPPGFQADGISRFMNVIGTEGATAGGGISGKTLGIIGGAGGAGAALLLLGGGSDTTTTGPVGGITTSSPSSSSTSTAIGSGSSTTTTSTGGGGGSTTTVGGGGSTTTTTVVGGTTTTIPGSTTTTVVGGSTTTTSTGSSTTTSIGSSTTTSAGSSSTTAGSSTTTAGSTTTTTTAPTTTTTAGSTTTVSTSTTTSVPSTTTSAPTTTTTAAGASFSITKSASGPAVRGGSFVYTITVTNNGPGTANNVLMRDDLPPQVTVNGTAGGCSGGTSPIQCGWGTMTNGQQRVAQIDVGVPSGTPIGTVLTNNATVYWQDPTLKSASTSLNSTVNSLRTDVASELQLTYRSFLDLPPADGRVRGRIVVNGSQARETDNSGPQTNRGPASSGTNRIEAFVEDSGNRRGAWQFDFSESPGFQAGSIRVESGEARAVTGSSVVFAVGTGTGPIRFTFSLAEEGERRRR